MSQVGAIGVEGKTSFRKSAPILAKSGKVYYFLRENNEEETLLFPT